MNVIECVPNVSEGRSGAHVDAIAGAVASTPGVHLLDRSSDVAHNRSVLTFAGDAGSLLAAVLALFRAALPLIDLGLQRGEHPRMGAVDVVPFVPLASTPMAECVALAREAGAAIAATFDVPVYLYEEAAVVPERRRLEWIRRGEFEGLASKMMSREWTPDFGPAAPHPTAGATAVGARQALIAFNVNLRSSQLDVAKAIARRVRESSGGLPYVKALGLPLRNRDVVQVSMNLTNYEATPIERAFDAVAACAREGGVDVLESELIGLIPAAALANTTPEHLKLRDFSIDCILEERLRRRGL
jgi:glutamate formiminotransferase